MGSDFQECSQQIVTPHVLPYGQRHNLTLQQDYARCHTARYTMELLNRDNVDVLDWPSRSPDLSSIEHMWDMLGRRVRERPDVNSLAGLDRALHEECTRIPVRDVNKLMNSMRKRSEAVMAADCGHTHY